jgi:MFS family permease
MRKIASSLIAPVLSLVIIMLGNGFFVTFVSLRLHELKVSSFLIGLISSAYFAGLLIGSVRAEKLILRIGFIRTFATFASFFTLLVMVNGLMNNSYVWLALRFFQGICIAGLFVVIESWLLMYSDRNTRGKVLSIYMSALYTAQAAAQFFLSFLPLESILPFACVVILSSLSVIPVSMMRASYPTMSEPSYISAKKLFMVSPFGFITCVLAGMILSSIYSLAPIFAQDMGFTIKQVASFMGFIILGGFLLQWPIGHLSDIFERRKVMILVCALTAVLSLVMTLSFVWPIWMTFGIAIAFGGFSFTIYPLGITLTSDRIDSKHLIAATGMLLLAYSWGSIFGPMIASLSISLFGPIGLFIYTAVISGLLVAYGLTVAFKKPPVPVKEQGEYVAVPRTTPIANELDPRSDDTPKGQS